MLRCVGFVFVWFLQVRRIVRAFQQRLGRRQPVERVGHGSHELRDAFTRGGRDRVKLDSRARRKTRAVFRDACGPWLRPVL